MLYDFLNQYKVGDGMGNVIKLKIFEARKYFISVNSFI